MLWHAVLHNLQVVDTVAFELQQSKAARDWSQEPGRETRCGLLATFARTPTGVLELDAGDTIWQINWVRVTEPADGQSIKSNDNVRLWFPLTLRDEAGSIVLYITEQAVVKLAKVVDAAEFEQLHVEGRLRFPFFGSCKNIPVGKFHSSFEIKKGMKIFPYTNIHDLPTSKN